ncbi:hypothetical protein QJS10_CPB18g00249 [Acorus calamus]|uniref:Uncharacterized protein n=1 Tax=Acorus calamus TaxID=4465 RepID=A0AAV9CNR2_ACOCL|nr:hypothetical protein QJS10_CPB18g00249 [Acorus calamus]
MANPLIYPYHHPGGLNSAPSPHPTVHAETPPTVPSLARGTPGDVKERELRNLLRWLPGFEASQVHSTVQSAIAAMDALQVAIPAPAPMPAPTGYAATVQIFSNL